VFGFPTLIVFDGNGQKLWRFEGYLPGADLIAQLEKLHKD
jgi:thioredoxin-related protein